MKFSHFIFPAIFGTAALSGRAEVLLKGLAITGGEPRFSLYSTEDQTTKWVALGQSFAGYKAESFDSRTETLVLAKGDSRQSVRLQSSVIKALTPGEEANARLRSLSGMDLAQELANRGDAEIAATLKQYQSIRTRFEEVAKATSQSGGVDAESAKTAVRFLERQSEELKAQVLKSAATKAAILLGTPPKP
jgi:uncharacterized protein